MFLTTTLLLTMAVVKKLRIKAILSNAVKTWLTSVAQLGGFGGCTLPLPQNVKQILCFFRDCAISAPNCAPCPRK